MAALRHAGLFGEEPIDVRGTPVVPRDVLAALLFPQWTFEDGEADLTVMRIAVDGLLDGVRTRLAWDLVDRLDPETGFTSMSRTTGFTAAICARLIADGTIDDPGVHPPERLASIDGVPETMVKQLRKRGVRYDARVESLD